MCVGYSRVCLSGCQLFPGVLNYNVLCERYRLCVTDPSSR